jgi:UPF0176 protein
MEMIILFYNFSPLKDTEATRLWQKALCEKLALKGRIIISRHGINATLGGQLVNLKSYVKELKTFKAFTETKVKWSDGGSHNYPKLSVKVRDELVTFGAADELKVNSRGVIGGGKHLSPEQVHKLVQERGEEVTFLDARSSYEAAVGRFKGAVVPDVRTAKDFISEIEKPKYNKLKNKPVVTYCTGGIRCEILSALMKRRGFKDVYQIDGGIVKYGEKYGDEGLWEGSLYVFDGRMGTKFSDKSIDIGNCIFCQGKTSNYENCANKACNDLVLICEKCSRETYCQSCAKVYAEK